MWVVNKSGGLAFYKSYDSSFVDVNETLRLASIWHSLHAISRTVDAVSPVDGCRGIELVECDAFDVRCFETSTGVKFLAVAKKRAIGIERLLKNCYDAYADYACKNPFVEPEMPIRSQLFEEKLRMAVTACNGTNAKVSKGGGFDERER